MSTTLWSALADGAARRARIGAARADFEVGRSNGVKDARRLPRRAELEPAARALGVVAEDRAAGLVGVLRNHHLRPGHRQGRGDIVVSEPSLPAPRPLPALFPARCGPQLEVLLLPHQVAEAERRHAKAGQTLLHRHASHVAGDRFAAIVDERAAVKPGPLLGVAAPPDMSL